MREEKHCSQTPAGGLGGDGAMLFLFERMVLLNTSRRGRFQAGLTNEKLLYFYYHLKAVIKTKFATQ